ncbi:MAG: hypothetical protein M3O30_02750 [Planctomycetota bacterium]|nr:hypothetical protein [Planctomycetota bacterium]
MPDRDSTALLTFGAWLGVQFAALAVAALRFSLSSRYPRAGEELALAVMLVAQTAAAALLFPVLLQTPRWTIIAIAAAWPMAFMASVLADVEIERFVICELYVSGWMLALYLWGWAVENPTARIFMPALAAMLSLGGPLAWYLHAEFGVASADINWSSAGALGPTLGALSLLYSPFFRSAWVMLGIIMIGGAIAAVIGQKRPKSLQNKTPSATS